jgi:hypothetical protein
MRLRLQVDTLHAYQVAPKPIGVLQVLQRFQGAVSVVIRFSNRTLGCGGGRGASCTPRIFLALCGAGDCRKRAG